MGAGTFPVQFNFEAFENISGVLGKIGGKIEELGSKTTGFNAKFQVAQKSTEHLREKLEKMGEKVTTVGEIMSIGVSAPLALLKHHFVESGIEAEETASKFGQVFKGIAEGARAGAVDELRKKFDLSTASAQDMLATTGIFTKNLGFGEKASLKMGETLAGLSVQMANFRGHGQSAADMSQVLEMALLGNYKGLKNLGITLSDDEIRQEALRAAQQGARFETVEQAKAAAALAVIMRKTKDDQEDYIESSGKLANQQRVSRELWKEISATMGRQFMPAAARMLELTNGIQRAFLALSPAGQKIAATLMTIAIATGPVLIVIGKLVSSVIPAMITGITALTSVSLPLLGTIALVIAAVAALGIAGYYIYKNWEPVKDFLLALWDGPLVRVLRFVSGIDGMIAVAKLIIENWTPIKAFFSGLFDWIGKAATWLWENSGLKLLIEGATKLGQLAIFGRGGQFGIQSDSPKGVGTGAEGAGIQAQAQQIGQTIVKEMRQTNDAKVQIDFSNMPRGVDVSSQKDDGPSFLNLGMMGAPL